MGGGGGIAGNVDRGFADAIGPIPALNIGIGAAVGKDGGNAGNGGDVTVNNIGSILTQRLLDRGGQVMAGVAGAEVVAGRGMADPVEGDQGSQHVAVPEPEGGQGVAPADLLGHQGQGERQPLPDAGDLPGQGGAQLGRVERLGPDDPGPVEQGQARPWRSVCL